MTREWSGCERRRCPPATIADPSRLAPRSQAWVCLACGSPLLSPIPPNAARAEVSCPQASVTRADRGRCRLLMLALTRQGIPKSSADPGHALSDPQPPPPLARRTAGIRLRIAGVPASAGCARGCRESDTQTIAAIGTSVPAGLRPGWGAAPGAERLRAYRGPHNDHASRAMRSSDVMRASTPLRTSASA